MAIQRKDYVDGKASHREYYGQFVTEQTKAFVCAQIGKKRILDSTNEHFNDIPLRLWDAMVSQSIMYSPVKLKDCGDYLTLATGVCILKEAARQIKEER